MRRVTFVTFTLSFLALVFARLDGHAAEPTEKSWTTLFDGKDLGAWTMGPEKSWVIEDGLVALKREWDAKEHNADYLWTRETYGDFVLELEFKITERANSGVFLRTADLKDPVYSGIEIQVCNSYGRKDLSRGSTCGAVYDCLAPSKNAVKKPGEWNQLRVTCKKSKITIVLNGEKIIDMDLDRWTQPKKNPDGSPNKFPKALKDFARAGHIGLQDHGLPVWYRNIRVRRLESNSSTKGA